MDVDIQSLPVYVHHRFPRCPEKQIGLPQKQIFVAPKTNNIAIEFEQHWHFWSNIQHSSCFSSKLILQVIQSSECLFGWVQLIFWPFLSLMFDHDRHHDLKPSLVFRLLVPVFTSPFPPSSCCAIEMCPQYKQQLIKREQQYQPYYQDLN